MRTATSAAEAIAIIRETDEETVRIVDDHGEYRYTISIPKRRLECDDLAPLPLTKAETPRASRSTTLLRAAPSL